jgi:hypothetical protein
MRGLYNNKRIGPPYAVDPSLYKNPSFKTTNMSDYTTQLGKNKYAKTKSKYKISQH